MEVQIYDVFICYAREDERLRERLVKILTGRGLSVFTDKDIPGGIPWRQKIESVLTHESHTTVLVLGTETLRLNLASGRSFIQDELERAKLEELPIVVLKMAPDIHRLLELEHI